MIIWLLVYENNKSLTLLSWYFGGTNEIGPINTYKYPTYLTKIQIQEVIGQWGHQVDLNINGKQSEQF